MGYPIVGERIEQRRKQLGMTLDDIANELGVAKSTIQRYEKGTIDNVKLPMIEAIARILSVNPAWICGKTDIMAPEKAPTPEGEREDSDRAAMVAFFRGADIPDEEMDEYWEDAKDYINFKMKQKRMRNK